MKQPPDNRHKGSIRSDTGIRYVVAALNGALLDPATKAHVRVQGGLFDGVALRESNAQQTIENLFAARHPVDGCRLRGKVNEGTRWQDGRRVSNTCHGFDFSLSADKSISIAGGLFHDRVVADATFEEQGRALKWLAKQACRRSGKSKSKQAVPAEGGVAMVLSPEKANRDGDPHLHTHGFCANLTKTLSAENDPVWVAVNFQRMATLNLAAHHRFNRKLFVRLQRLGYAVDFDGRICRLTSVPRSLCNELSKGAQRIGECVGSDKLGNPISSHRMAKMKDRAGTRSRPPKQHHTLEVWQQKWEKEIGCDRLKQLTADYHACRYASHAIEEPPPLPIPSVALTTNAESSTRSLGDVGALKSAVRQNADEEFRQLAVTEDRAVEQEAHRDAGQNSNIVESSAKPSQSGGLVGPSTDAQSPVDMVLPKEFTATVATEEDPVAELMALGLEFKRQYSERTSLDERTSSWGVTCNLPERFVSEQTPVRLQVLRAMLRLVLEHCAVQPAFREAYPGMDIEAPSGASEDVENLVGCFAEAIYASTADLPKDFDAGAVWKLVELEISKMPAVATVRHAVETASNVPEAPAFTPSAPEPHNAIVSDYVASAAIPTLGEDHQVAPAKVTEHPDPPLSALTVTPGKLRGQELPSSQQIAPEQEISSAPDGDDLPDL